MIDNNSRLINEKEREKISKYNNLFNHCTCKHAYYYNYYNMSKTRPSKLIPLLRPCV